MKTKIKIVLPVLLCLALQFCSTQKINTIISSTKTENQTDTIFHDSCYASDTSFDKINYLTKNVQEVRLKISTFETILGNSGLMLINFSNTSSGITQVKAISRGGTQNYTINFEVGSYVSLNSVDSFVFKPNILPQNIMKDFLAELTAEPGFNYITNPNNFKINFHPILEDIDGVKCIAFELHEVRLSDSQMSVTKKVTNPCPPCNK